MSDMIEIRTDLGGFLRSEKAFLEVLVDDADVIPKALTILCDGVSATYDRDHPLWCLIESQIDFEHLEDVVNDRRDQE